MSLAQTTDVAILETREASPSHFLVKIESFSMDGLHKYETGTFGAGGYEWRLKIYPNEDKTGVDKDYLSLYLAISDTTSMPPNWEVNAVFSFFLFNQISGNYLYSLGKTRRFLPMKQEWGISKFMSKKDLTDPSNGFLIDSSCVFGAEVFIVQKLAVFEGLLPKNVTVPYKPPVFECLLPKNVTVPLKHTWKISEFSYLGDVIWTSQKFVVGGFEWYVLLYPEGYIGDNKGK